MGMGHVQQSTTLAEELRDRAQISFLTKSGDPVLAMIREAGFGATRLGSDTEILLRLRSLQPDIVIFDKLDVAEELAREIKQGLNVGLVIFTNLTLANRHADVAITADIGSRFKNVVFRDESTGTMYYYGPRYWILRRGFYEYKRRGKAPPAATERILLLFGGSDPANHTARALEALLGLDQVSKLDVVLGAHFAHTASVNSVLERHSGKSARVSVHHNVKNVAELMYFADLVLASPGLSAFEALCVGTPVIVMPQDSLQRDTYQGFMRLLGCDEIGQLGGLLKRRDFTFPQDDQIAAMEIGEGVSELVSVILNLRSV